MSGLERRALGPAAAILAASLAAGSLLIAYLHWQEVRDHRATAAELARGSALAIEARLGSSLSAASILAAMVEEGAGERELDGVARRLLELSRGQVSVQLARDGVISHIWPMEGNEAAFGLDLVRHPIHGGFVQRLVETRAPLAYGPFRLVQGGDGLAVRVPIFVGEGTRERFWGLASAILRLQVLLEESRVAGLVAAGYDYALVREGAQGHPDEGLAGSLPAGRSLHHPVGVAFEIPGQRWRLDVAPRGGWANPVLSGALPIAVLLISLLAARLTYRAAALPALLRREVAARTRELEVAHAEQRRAEAAQRQSQKLESLGLLAGGVAHDFNNLLAAILGNADLIASEAKSGSATEEGSRTIVQAAQRAADLTRRLLALARLGQHRQERVDVSALAAEASAFLSRTLDKAIRLDVRAGPAPCVVLGDPGQLQQVILNLVVNARDAMPDGGSLELEVAGAELDAVSAPAGLAPGRYVTLAVSDTGVGIAPELRERIFEPFFTTKPEGRGSGLGLATVFGIVKGHGGTIRLYSEVGKGSRFVVYLPAMAEGEALAAPVEDRAPRGTGVVLVVDDEELVRRTAGRILASLGYEPVLAAGGQEALDWLERQPSPPSAVLLDLAMPGMDGRECYGRLRARDPGLRVVVSSGFSSDGRGEELLAHGAVAFVQKPYTTQELARALAAGRSPA